jgi:hypothetical protein
VHLKVLPINALGKSMSTKGTKHFPTFYLHFTYKYQQCTYCAFLGIKPRIDLSANRQQSNEIKLEFTAEKCLNGSRIM